MRTYQLPAEAGYLRAETRHFLEPLGFVESDARDASLRLVVQADAQGKGEGYTLERASSPQRETLTIRGESIAGATHGFHQALRLLGFEFSFFADAIPDNPRLEWPYPESAVTIRPTFSTRGFLAWHNFLNSPTTWNSPDYERYLRTLRRWGGNRVIFRQRDYGKGEPLAAIRGEDGQWMLGERMATSLNCPWGITPGIRTEEFGHQTGRFFEDARNGEWGAAHCFAPDPIEAAQEEFARVCAMARSLGVDVAFGYELGGDPSAPGIKSLTQKRIAHLIATYPDIRSLCVWHYEGWGLLGWKAALASPGYPELKKRYGKHFRYLAGNPAREAEGCRLAEWFLFLYETAKNLRPSLQVVFSGWGGDRWMRWGDYWKGLHEILPADVVFAQLDNIDPYTQEGVSRAGEGISSQRELWSIPWLESDDSALGRASQWHPQEDVGLMYGLARSAQALDYSGLLGIHWQTAGIEQNAACLIGTGWGRWPSAADFHGHYARRFFSPEASTAQQVATLLDDLERLGPGWTGTGQQIECATFSWDPAPALTTGTPSRELRAFAESLYPIRDSLADTPSAANIWPIFDRLRYACDQMRGDPQAHDKLLSLQRRFQALGLTTPHAQRLNATMNFVLIYEDIRRALMSGGWLALQRELIEEARERGLDPDPAMLAAHKEGLLKVEHLWADLFAAQTARLQTRGDWGNLATINVKAYAAWRKFKEDFPIGEEGESAQSLP